MTPGHSRCSCAMRRNSSHCTTKTLISQMNASVSPTAPAARTCRRLSALRVVIPRRGYRVCGSCTRLPSVRRRIRDEIEAKVGIRSTVRGAAGEITRHRAFAINVKTAESCPKASPGTCSRVSSPIGDAQGHPRRPDLTVKPPISPAERLLPSPSDRREATACRFPTTRPQPDENQGRVVGKLQAVFEGSGSGERGRELSSSGWGQGRKAQGRWVWFRSKGQGQRRCGAGPVRTHGVRAYSLGPRARFRGRGRPSLELAPPVTVRRCRDGRALSALTSPSALSARSGRTSVGHCSVPRSSPGQQ
jgi:hypothetical protein